MFIVVEGIDGSGKTTFLNKLKEYVPDALYLREPGSTPFGESLRSILMSHGPNNMSVALAMHSARLHLVEERMRPALEKNQKVFCDRYYPSMLAYQDYKENPFLLNLVFSTKTLEPDIVILLDCPAEIANERGDKVSIFDKKPIHYHEKIRKHYLEMAKEWDWLVLDSSKEIDLINVLPSKIFEA